MFHLLYITNNPEVALMAERNGVDRIWLDLEKNGKENRQRGKDSVISHHTLQDICNVRKVINEAKLLVRINPWFVGSKKEIDDVIAAGADIIMLPMWKTCEEVERFIDAVNGRVKTLLLLETKEAAETAIDDVLEKGLAEEIHIGLRDLSLSYGIDFLFSMYATDVLERVSLRINKESVPFGIGGVGKFGIGLMPGPERLLIEDIRLGASSVILARTFCNSGEYSSIDDMEKDFANGIRELRKWEKIATHMSDDIFTYNRTELIRELKEG